MPVLLSFSLNECGLNDTSLAEENEAQYILKLPEDTGGSKNHFREAKTMKEEKHC